MKKKNDLTERAKQQVQGAGLASSIGSKTQQRFEEAHAENPTPTKEEAIESVLDGLDPTTKSMMVSLFGKIEELKEQINRSHPRKKLSDDEARFTLNCPKEYIEKIREIAHINRVQIRDVICEAFKQYIEEYEEENGTIKVIEKVNK